MTIQEMIKTANARAQLRHAPDHLCEKERVKTGEAFSLYYDMIYFLVEMMKPKLIVELGVCSGRGALYLARGAPGARVIGIDPEPWDIPIWQAACPNIEIRKLRSDDHRAYDDLQDIDLLFIDSEHHGNYARIETDIYLPRMAKDSVILYDDVDLNDSMKEFWTTLQTQLETMELPTMHFSGFGAAFLFVEQQNKS